MVATALAVCLVVSGLGYGAFAGVRAIGRSSVPVSPTPFTTPPSSSLPTPSPLPLAEETIATMRFSPTDTQLFDVRDGTLFVVVIPGGDQRGSFTIERIEGDGSVSENRLLFDLTDYIDYIDAGPGGVYVGTLVIQKFTEAPDELLRIDPTGLQVVARATFRGSVAVTVEGEDVWASIGDGRVVRLDPITLAVRAESQGLPPLAPVETGASLSRPALGEGSLWVVAGDEGDLELVRMDPASLTVLSRAKLPTRGQYYQALNRVVGDARHVYVTGNAIQQVDANGELVGTPAVISGLQGVEIWADGLVGVISSDGRPALVLLDAEGGVLASTNEVDAGADLTVTGDEAWFLGDAGDGFGIVHVRLVAPPNTWRRRSPFRSARCL
jgi:hypothetical protein